MNRDLREAGNHAICAGWHSLQVAGSVPELK